MKEVGTCSDIIKLDSLTNHRELFSSKSLYLFQMGLKKCENTFIGIPGISKGISGSERKCLAFAEKV